MADHYVPKAKARLGLQSVEVMVPQEHPLGAEAEVDWGEARFRLDGEMVSGCLFVMRLSASGKTFRRAYVNEAQDSFLDAHVRAFEYFGGVPDRVRYDNLKTAVVKVLCGRDRDENERFVLLRSHYGFDSFFCRPGIAGAHEKGGVEGEIGRFRRKAFVPVPEVRSMIELNAHVATVGARDDLRHIGNRRLSVADHFDVEAQRLQPLPVERFDATTRLSCRVDPKSRVCVRQAWYSVPARFVGRRLDVQLSADMVDVFDGNTQVASHARSPFKGVDTLVLDHYLEVLVRKPGALLNATALTRARQTGVFTSVHQQFWDLARRNTATATAPRP